MTVSCLVTAFFWSSFAVLLLVYPGYPLLLWAAGKVLAKDVKKAPGKFKVSVLISAYNEEKHIAQTIENKLAIDYPAELLEIIVVSDGSTDRTEEIVRGYAGRGVRLMVQKERRGKTSALNAASEQASGEILVFSDANSLYESSALRKILANFSDGLVGYVTGKMVYVDERGSLVGEGCSAYMRYENLLRALETRIGSVVGVDGGIDAVRKKLYEPMAPEHLPDFILPLRVVRKGYRVVYEPEAVLKENSLTKTSDEWKMRVRVSLRSFHALWSMRSLLNPWGPGGAVFSLQLSIHKLLRYMAGYFQAVLLASNFFIVGKSQFYLVFLVLQAAFYGASFLGFLMRENSRIPAPLKLAHYFCLLNAAALWASLKFLRGEKTIVWEPRKG